MTEKQEKIINIIHQSAIRKRKLLDWNRFYLMYETNDIGDGIVSVDENGSIYYNDKTIYLGEIKSMIKEMVNFK